MTCFRTLFACLALVGAVMATRVVYVIAGGKVRNHATDGSINETSYTAGRTLYREPVTHWAENIGTTTIRLIIVELKDR